MNTGNGEADSLLRLTVRFFRSFHSVARLRGDWEADFTNCSRSGAASGPRGLQPLEHCFCRHVVVRYPVAFTAAKAGRLKDINQRRPVTRRTAAMSVCQPRQYKFHTIFYTRESLLPQTSDQPQALLCWWLPMVSPPMPPFLVLTAYRPAAARPDATDLPENGRRTARGVSDQPRQRCCTASERLSGGQNRQTRCRTRQSLIWQHQLNGRFWRLPAVLPAYAATLKTGVKQPACVSTSIIRSTWPERC